jgi:hypothetical protein
MTALTEPTCRHCRTGSETFSYLGGAYLFDVDAARELVANRREPVEVDEESVRLSMDGLRLVPEHLDHVDPRFPGIIAHVRFNDPTGEVLHGHVLIDGNHRAARCLRDRLPFFAHLLTPTESEAVLLRSPTVDAH